MPLVFFWLKDTFYQLSDMLIILLTFEKILYQTS